MNILIIAPHPDDEILGCGGTILKHIKNNDNIYLCIMTKGDINYYGEQTLQEKRQEVLKVAEFLNIKKVFFCDFISAHLDTYPQNQINQKLREIIQEVKPHTIYLPHQGDLHRDHQITFQCTLVASKPILNPYIKRIISYEALSETEQSSQYTTPFIPNYYINITEELEKKKHALTLYPSELRPYPHPRSPEALEIKAKARGIEIGVLAAEAFMIIKQIE